VYLTKDPLSGVKRLLKEDHPGVRCVSAWVLYCARAIDIKEAIAVQRETLKGADSWARLRAIGYLGSLGPSAAVALDDLGTLLEDANTEEAIREAAAKALERIRKKH